jgi:DNA-directed RNA polymerase specialized sigma24 family protein
MSAWTEGPTHWSQLLPTQEKEGWSYFYSRYSPAVAAFFRRRGVASGEVDDLVHEFFLATLGRGFLARADPERGRFRGYLATAAQRFLATHWRDSKRQKRNPASGGVVSLDEGEDVPAESGLTPEEAFDLAWARGVLARATVAAEEGYRAKGKGDHVDAFRRKQAGETWQAIATALGSTPPAVRGWADRYGERLARCVREEVAGTVPDEAHLDQELTHLSQILERGE